MGFDRDESRGREAGRIDSEELTSRQSTSTEECEVVNARHNREDRKSREGAGKGKKLTVLVKLRVRQVSVSSSLVAIRSDATVPMPT